MSLTDEPDSKSSSSSTSSSNQNTNVQTSSNDDVKQFIYQQLKENLKDRPFMLGIEKDLYSFLRSDNECFKFKPMNPYYRMLVHRICDYFGLGHNLDNSRQSIIVNKASKTMPTVANFQSIIINQGDLEQKQQEKKKILKREVLADNSTQSETKETNSKLEIKQKTYEEKSAEYLRIKNRIFNENDSISEKPKQVKILNRQSNSFSAQNQIIASLHHSASFPNSNSPNRPAHSTFTSQTTHATNKKNRNLNNTITTKNSKKHKFKAQIYNLKENLTREKINDLLSPFIESIDFKLKNNNENLDQDKFNIINETNFDIFIEFENFDKLEEAFKLFNINDNNNLNESKPFLIKPIHSC